jgi:anaerobic magnesium-protoporphyrin IX monomethyl ester cyclase
VVVLGEGDLTIQEIAREVGEGRRDFSKIKGIVFNQGNRFVETPPAPLLRDLDLLPEPALELVKREKYRFDVFGKDNFVTCLETSRGCPYGCDFCSVTPTWGNKWRNKSNKRIMREIEKAKELGYNWVFFVDDIFVVWPNRSHREKLFREIIDRRIGIKFIAQMRADVTARNPDLVKMAAEAGLRVAFLGVESGSQETLRKMHKGIAVPDSIKAVKVLHQNGVIVLVGLIVGAPYEGFRELMATVRLSRELADAGADGVQFSVYTPLPGTRVFVNLLREGRILTLNWDYYDLLTPVLRTRVNPLIVQLLSLYANHSFYVRKYIKGKLGRGVRSQGDKARLLRQAEKYMWRRLPHFAQVTLVDFPLSLIKTLLLYVRRERLSQEVVSELISQSQRIVYEEGVWAS